MIRLRVRHSLLIGLCLCMVLLLMLAPLSTTLAQSDYTIIPAGDSSALSAALQTANARGTGAAPYKIYLQPGEYQLAADTQTSLVTLPDITGNAVIYGQNTTLLFDVTSTGQRAPITILPGAQLDIHNLNLLLKAGVGRTIFNQGALTVVDSSFGGPDSVLNGGGIRNAGTLTITRTTFQRVGYVSSSEPGGAILSTGGLSVSCTLFQGSVATTGGAIYVDGSGQARISQSAFSDNRANGGGAIFNKSNRLVDATNNWWKNGAPVVEMKYSGLDTISDGVTVDPIAQSDPTLSRECLPHAPEAQPKQATTTTSLVTQPDVVAAQISRHGFARVIVELNMNYVLESNLSSPQAVQTQRATIQAQQVQLLTSLKGLNATLSRQYDFVPAMAMTVDAAALQALSASPLVAAIEPDQMLKLDAYPSYITAIGAPAVWTLGYDGTGYVVAILDSGVDKTHPYLTGKVVSEACYSSNIPVYNVTSVCPGGVTSSTAVGSGGPCPLTIDGCDHGTHVAGIAAGANGTYGSTNLNGIAKGANIIAIQVFSQSNDSVDCDPYPTPCIGAWNSDILAGLQRVYALRSTYTISSLNLSLGGGQYSSTCDTAVSSVTTAITNLRNANIASVIATGNEYYTGSMGWPACISTAVSVGATSTSTGSDSVASFSNHSNLVTVLAPGVSILSSVPGGSYQYWDGTSMATPHVTGAFAMLRQKAPTATVSQLVTALQTTGVGVTRSGITRPRIQLDAALALLTPSAITQTAPIGNITVRQPTFTWQAQTLATSYHLIVQTGTGTVLLDQTYTSSVCSGSTCSVTPSLNLDAYYYSWYISGIGPGGTGPASGKDFVVAIAPAAIVQSGPTGAYNGRNPVLTWQKDRDAQNYGVALVTGSGTQLSYQWYTAATVCSGSTCSLNLSLDLASDYYSWYIGAAGVGGSGPWSGQHFYVTALPTAVTQTAPIGNVTVRQPTFTWQAQRDSGWYGLAIVNSAGTLVLQQWYTASAVCSSGTCSVTPTLDLDAGDYNWYLGGYSLGGSGTWSFKTLTVAIEPGPMTLTSPSGTVATKRPTLTWQRNRDAYYYGIYLVNLDTGVYTIQEWQPAASMCTGNTCTRALTADLPSGNYRWYIGATNNFGQAWGNMDFIVP